MITNGEKWHYLTVRNLSALLKEITSIIRGDNCIHSHRTKEALEKHMEVCENKDCCYIGMPEKGASLKYHGVKSMRAPFVMYADLESLPKKSILVLMIRINHQQPRKIRIKCVVIH